jgi:O-antigen/teichoic acid export membrane protein
MMQKKFLSNLVWMIFFNLLIKPYAIFGIDAEVQNRVGTEEYGLYFSLLNFSYLFNIVLDLGITNYNTKYVAQYPTLVKRYLGNILTLRLVLFIIYVVVSVGFALLIGYDSAQFWFVWVLIFNQFLISGILFFRSYFAGLLLFKWDILLSILDRILLIGIVAFLLFSPLFKGHFEIKWFVLSQTASYFIALLIGFILVFTRIGIPRLHWGISFNLVILRKSFPYALLILLMMLYSRVDSLMIERLHKYGNLQVGIYAQAFSMFDASFMFLMLFSNLLFPIFSRLIQERGEIKILLNAASKLLVAFSTFMAFICMGFAYFILNAIYEQDTLLSVPTFRILMISFIPTSIVLVYGTLLTANGNLKRLNILSFIGLLLNIALNFMFIPTHGAFGAAVATLSTQSLIALIYFVSVWKQFELRFSWWESARYSLFLIYCLIAYYISKWANTEELQLISFVLCLILGNFVFGLIPLRALISSFKKE